MNMRRRQAALGVLVLMLGALAPSSTSTQACASPGPLAGAPVTAVAAGPSVLGPRPAAAGWAWPLQPRPAVVTPFAAPPKPWLSGHRGIDLATQDGQIIYAPADGVVSFAGTVVDRPVLTITHANGVRSSFEPVAATVEVGASVGRGQPIGTIAGLGHCRPDSCLHWGVRPGSASDVYVDPLQFILDLRPSVLLPTLEQ